MLPKCSVSIRVDHSVVLALANDSGRGRVCSFVAERSIGNLALEFRMPRKHSSALVLVLLLLAPARANGQFYCEESAVNEIGECGCDTQVTRPEGAVKTLLSKPDVLL